MRRQYHFRPSPEGLQSWDVHKLIAKSKELPVIRIPLSEISELDENYWFDHGPPTVRSVAQHAKLIEEANLSYPIILCHEGRVMDGMHRVAKALMIGITEIEAVRFTEYVAPDFVGVEPEDLEY